MARVLRRSGIDVGDPIENARQRIKILGEREDFRVLQRNMKYSPGDIGGYVLAFKSTRDTVREWYFLTADPDGSSCWINGWDQAEALSECFRIFNTVDAAENAANEYLAAPRLPDIDLMGIFRIDNRKEDDLLFEHVETYNVTDEQ